MARANSNHGRMRDASLTIRRARRADLPALTALYDQLHVNSYMDFRVAPARLIHAFDRLSRSRHHWIMVAERDGIVVGTCHVIIVPHLGHGLKPFAIVENVVVDDHARSLGIGEQLIEAATAVARQAGCYKMALTSNLVRLRAHQFYERLGWRKTHLGYSLALEKSPRANSMRAARRGAR